MEAKRASPEMARTSLSSFVFPEGASQDSSSALTSKWSSAGRLFWFVTMMISSMPRYRFFDHVLQYRLVDDRQHFFGERFGLRQKPRAKPRDRNDCLSYFLHKRGEVRRHVSSACGCRMIEYSVAETKRGVNAMPHGEGVF